MATSPAAPYPCLPSARSAGGSSTSVAVAPNSGRATPGAATPTTRRPNGSSSSSGFLFAAPPMEAPPLASCGFSPPSWADAPAVNEGSPTKRRMIPSRSTIGTSGVAPFAAYTRASDWQHQHQLHHPQQLQQQQPQRQRTAAGPSSQVGRQSPVPGAAAQHAVRDRGVAAPLVLPGGARHAVSPPKSGLVSSRSTTSLQSLTPGFGGAPVSSVLMPAAATHPGHAGASAAAVPGPCPPAAPASTCAKSPRPSPPVLPPPRVVATVTRSSPTPIACLSPSRAYRCASPVRQPAAVEHSAVLQVAPSGGGYARVASPFRRVARSYSPATGMRSTPMPTWASPRVPTQQGYVKQRTIGGPPPRPVAAVPLLPPSPARTLVPTAVVPSHLPPRALPTTPVKPKKPVAKQPEIRRIASWAPSLPMQSTAQSTVSQQRTGSLSMRSEEVRRFIELFFEACGITASMCPPEVWRDVVRECGSDMRAHLDERQAAFLARNLLERIMAFNTPAAGGTGFRTPLAWDASPANTTGLPQAAAADFGRRFQDRLQSWKFGAKSGSDKNASALSLDIASPTASPLSILPPDQSGTVSPPTRLCSANSPHRHCADHHVAVEFAAGALRASQDGVQAKAPLEATFSRTAEVMAAPTAFSYACADLPSNKVAAAGPQRASLPGGSNKQLAAREPESTPEVVTAPEDTQAAPPNALAWAMDACLEASVQKPFAHERSAQVYTPRQATRRDAAGRAAASGTPLAWHPDAATSSAQVEEAQADLPSAARPSTRNGAASQRNASKASNSSLCGEESEGQNELMRALRRRRQRIDAAQDTGSKESAVAPEWGSRLSSIPSPTRNKRTSNDSEAETEVSEVPTQIPDYPQPSEAPMAQLACGPGSEADVSQLLSVVISTCATLAKRLKSQLPLQDSDRPGQRQRRRSSSVDRSPSGPEENVANEIAPEAAIAAANAARELLGDLEMAFLSGGGASASSAAPPVPALSDEQGQTQYFNLDTPTRRSTLLCPALSPGTESIGGVDSGTGRPRPPTKASRRSSSWPLSRNFCTKGTFTEEDGPDPYADNILGLLGRRRFLELQATPSCSTHGNESRRRRYTSYVDRAAWSQDGVHDLPAALGAIGQWAEELLQRNPDPRPQLKPPCMSAPIASGRTERGASSAAVQATASQSANPTSPRFQFAM